MIHDLGVGCSAEQGHGPQTNSLTLPLRFVHYLVGGGEGATLKEVLKHKTVQSVTMVEIDEEVIQIVKQLLTTFPIVPICWTEPMIALPTRPLI